MDTNYESVDQQRSPLYLVPTEESSVAEMLPTVVQGPDGYPQLSDLPSPDRWVIDEMTIGSSETIKIEFVLCQGPTTSGFPTGNYDCKRGPLFTVVHSTEPGPTVDSRFEGISVPPIGKGDVPDPFCGATIQWYHETSKTDTSWVAPQTEVVESADSYHFYALNRAPLILTCGKWFLFRQIRDSWEMIAPDQINFDCPTLYPGRQKTFQLRTDLSTDKVSHDDVFRMGTLEPGRYAIVCGFGVETGYSGALFDVVDS
jgi:hypothetical protein